MIWRYDVFRQSEGQLQGEALAGRLHNYDCGGSERQLQGRSTRGAITQLRLRGIERTTTGGQEKKKQKIAIKDKRILIMMT